MESPPPLNLPNRLTVLLNGVRIGIPLYLLPFFPYLDTMLTDMGGLEPSTAIPLSHELGQISEATLSWLIYFYEAYAMSHGIVANVEEARTLASLPVTSDDLAQLLARDLNLARYLSAVPLMELFEFCHFSDVMGSTLALQLGLLQLVERLLTDAELPDAGVVDPLPEEIPLFRANPDVADYILSELPYARRYLHILGLVRSVLHPDLTEQVLVAIPPPTMSPVVCGDEHTMLIAYQGLFACGSNDHGQLGLGESEEADRFIAVPYLQGALISVACGFRHTLVLTTRGLFACGWNTRGPLGLGKQYGVNQLRRVVTEGRPLAIFCGRSHSALITTDGLFVCGENGHGELGLGGEDDIFLFERVAVKGRPLSLAFGPSHTMLITDAGLFACGFNDEGQLGLGVGQPGETQGADTFREVKLIRGTPLSVVCGERSTLLVTTHGLYGCGSNKYGQIGFGNANWERTVFTTVANRPPGTVLSLSTACAASHTMLLTTGGLFGCGVNEEGELGLGNTGVSYSFEEIPYVHLDVMKDLEPIFVACGNGFTMLMTRGGLLSCGDNESSQLGLGDVRNAHMEEFHVVPIVLRSPQSERPEKKRRLGCHICEGGATTMLQEVERPERLFCSLHCQKRYHWFGRVMGGGPTHKPAVLTLDMDATIARASSPRSILFTNKLQLIIQVLPPGGKVEREVHRGDQFIRVERGALKATAAAGVVHHLEAGGMDTVVIPEGTYHELEGEGGEGAKFYTLYAPPAH
jgi:alpha-tubulin suppressor-like RCC1 family protein